MNYDARREAEAIRNALAMHDEGMTFAEIARVMERTETWARDAIVDFSLEQRAAKPLAPLH